VALYTQDLHLLLFPLLEILLLVMLLLLLLLQRYATRSFP
jgi:hypothetical protein